MMKRLSLLLVVIFTIGLMVSSLNALEVTIGAGDQQARLPMDFYWGNSLFETLYYPDELGFVSGTITSLEFYNNFTSNLSNMPTKIWLGTTNQQDLSGGWIPASQLTLVFDGTVNYPSGANTITIQLQTPYMHTPGNLVMMVNRPMEDDWHSSTDYFQCQTVGSTRSRKMQSDSTVFDPYNPTGGTVSGQFPKTKITYSGQAIINDLGALSIVGNTTPSVGNLTNYVITVKNNGTANQSNYQVKLMSGTNELASLDGPTINSLQTIPVTLSWTPTSEGALTIYGKVVMTGDEIDTNNQTPNLNIAVQPAGVNGVTIGEGNQTARMPMDFYYKSSLYECLYFPDELGFVSGTITSIALYNSFVTNNPNGATKIWLGNTNVQNLSGGWIPSTQMTLVFDGVLQFPSGQNTITIPLQTPHIYTPGNLVMMVKRPLDGAYYSSSDTFLCQTIGSNRAINMYSDSVDYDPANPSGGTVTGQFPKTTFFYTTQTIEHDLGALSIAGNTTPSVGTASTYTVSVKNNGSNTESNYQVKLMNAAGNVELASIDGTAIQSMETLDFNIPWTPTAMGPMTIYGKVVMTGDEIATNNQTPNLNLVVQAAGVVAVTVGDGGSTGRYPFDFYWKNSLFETIYQASEMNIGGVITGIQFYNQFSSNINNTPIKIWLGETAQTDLSGGYIPATELDLVYDSSMSFPSGANNILIPIDPPWPYGGGNLVLMANRPMDTDYYSSADNFVVQSGTVNNRSRYDYSDSTNFNPDAPTGGTQTAIFPKTTFMLVTEGMGSLSGTVYGPGNTPLAGATVSVANSSLTYTTGADGTYSFPYIYEGSQTVSATKHGYTVDTQTVTIVEDQITTQNFTIVLLPQVTVSGRIVGSDQPTVGIADATITLSGYEPYSATTNAQGQFTIANVFASQTYQYVATVLGYQSATGQAVVGTTNLEMGDIIVNEMAFPPFNVQASENDSFTQVNLSWDAPDPNAVDITEGFEDDTFPPEDWNQIINNTNAGGAGVMATWCRFGTVALTPPVPPTEGDWQAGLWWEYDEQDEWLITPQFVCPGNAVLTFDSYVFLGSTYDDHYYVKASTDNGATWQVLWDASALTGDWNYYDVPITVPLDAVAGQQVKLAFHALSAPGDGLWYVWFIDNVFIGNATRTIKFDFDQLTTKSASQSANNRGFVINNSGVNLPTSKAKMTNPDLVEGRLNLSPANNERVMMGYKVWRLQQGQESNEALWTSLTPTNITPTNYTDTAWQPLPSGVYKYAVKAAYTNNVYSNAAFSNAIHKGMMGVLTGTVTEFGTDIPIAGATITAGEYSGTSNAQGLYSFSVYAGTYNVTCAKPGYQTSTQNGVVMVGLQTTTLDFVLTEITLPAGAVQAVVAGDNVNITWMEPGTSGGEWLSYCGEKDDSIGTGGVVEFDVAVRYPPSDLTDYIGQSLHAVKVWPAQAGTFAVRVWTGGTAAAPGAQVVNQPFTPNLDVYNTVVLSEPVTITGTEELWFGYNCNVTSGYPAGCDSGPAINGFGNMMYFQGAWDTLLGIEPSLDYNWNIEGYVGYSAPTDAPRISMLGMKAAYPGQYDEEMNRALTGYRVWRLLQGQESNESTWTSLTTNPISATAYQDGAWGDLADGTYKWAVKAIYTGGAASVAALSNPLPKITQIGTVAGIVRNQQNAPISGATVTCVGYTATTNASGAYSMQVIAGTHSVTASHPNYAAVTQQNITVVTGQTTTVNFILPPSADLLVDGFESYDNFAIAFDPWTLVDVDQSGTYGVSGCEWPNNYQPQAYIIFNPSATTPPLAAEPHGGAKMAACFAATTPPNDDWLITPQLTGVSEIKFWAKSHTTEYGMERFKVGVSTSGTAPSDFTIISGGNYIQVPDQWTEYTYDLASYSGSPVYIGINCVSNDAFIFLVDDVLVTGVVDADDPVIPVFNTALMENYPNPFNPETTISYSLSESQNVKIEIYNVKGQLVRTLVNDAKAAGNHTVVWTGLDNHKRPVSSGIYYYKMTAGKYSSSKKMILMK